jgi:hypothetical protein
VISCDNVILWILETMSRDQEKDDQMTQWIGWWLTVDDDAFALTTNADALIND